MMSDYEIPQHEMIVVAFDDETKAEQALGSLKGMEAMDIVDLKSGAVIVRSASGDVKIKETSEGISPQFWRYRCLIVHK